MLKKHKLKYIMGCAGCSSGGCGTSPKGCKNNGSCGTGGCNKLNAFDWLGNMDLPSEQKFDVVEVRFKGGRKDFFRNTSRLELYTGDPIITDMQSGYHLGYVSLQGEVVRLQMLKKKIENNEDIRSIIRLASDKDLEKFEMSKNREMPTLYRTREIIKDLKLKMKLSDIEFQADNSKATFYYSADDRVDFRELIKVLAGEFKIRVEMRQISLRQEASRLGGLGSCGRELCCSTWLTDFKSVSTTAARYQNLSLNPAKLSGQCGRLKCCLNYELETYLDALVDIPKVDKPLQTEQGEAKLEKVDIFKKLLWFSIESESTWHSLEAERVHEILELNKKGIKVSSLKVNEFADIEIFDRETERGQKKKTNRRNQRRKKKPNQADRSTNEARSKQSNTGKNNTTTRDSKSHNQSKSSNSGDKPKRFNDKKSKFNPNSKKADNEIKSSDQKQDQAVINKGNKNKSKPPFKKRNWGNKPSNKKQNDSNDSKKDK